MKKNIYVNKLYKFVRPEGKDTFLTRGFALIRYLESGKVVLGKLDESGKVVREFPESMYPAAIQNKGISLEELSKRGVGVYKTPTKKQKSKKVSDSKFWKPLKRELPKVSSEEQLREQALRWWKHNRTTLESLTRKKAERLVKKGKSPVITKFILSSKYLPKDKALWEPIATELLKESPFAVYDIKEFGIRFFVN